jgi:UDP-N-acetylglucosamine:LPS N-acetylglucosamine transferase
MLQDIIESGAHQLQTSSILVEGRPSDLPNHFQIKNSLTKLRYASGQDLLDIILQSEYVVCRSGYSTLMELLPLYKKMILVPTPGQTEQEYLASSLANRQMALMIDQASFDLASLNEKADKHCFIFAT